MAEHHRERFEALILPHLDDAYTLARYLLRNGHDAQDVVQDAALRAFRYFDRYRDGDPRAWFLAIVRNCCFTWRRRHRGDRLTISFDDDVAPALEGSTATDAMAIARSDQAALERAVGTLSIEFREVVVLREVQGMSYSQIAAVVGVPIGTVMSRLSRARMRLAAVLGAGAKEAS